MGMLVIGHRGARGLAPENTVKSFQKALEHHVDEIEFDVRVTGDGIAVLHHDAAIKNPSGPPLEIAKRTYKELLEHKPDLARFSDVLEQFGGKVGLYIEVKPGVPTKPIIKAVKEYIRGGGMAESLSLASFSQKVLVELHKALPEIEKIVLEKWSSVSARLRAEQVGTKRVVMDQRWMWVGFIAAFSRHYQLGVYTLNDPRKARRWQKHGLHSLVTDYPDRFEK